MPMISFLWYSTLDKRSFINDETWPYRKYKEEVVFHNDDESKIFCTFFSLLGVLESRPDTEGDSEPGSGLWLREAPGGDARNINTQGNGSPVPWSGSAMFWFGSGSSVPYFWTMDADPDPAFSAVSFRGQRKFFVLFITIPDPTEYWGMYIYISLEINC